MIPKIRQSFESLPFLFGMSISMAALTAVAVSPASDFVITRSISIERNFYILGGIMLLVMLTSSVQTLLAIRLIWGARAVWGYRPLQAIDDDDGNDLQEMRALKATNTKKALVLFVLIALNIIVFDRLGSGFLFSDTRTYRVTTLLRSPHGQNRADAVHEAIFLIGDHRVEIALKRVLDHPGPAREWAAYAAGIRGDQSVRDSLITLLQSGNPRERSASAMALARLGDERLIPAVRDAYPHAEELAGELVKALGMLSQLARSRIGEENRAAAGVFLAELLHGDPVDREVNGVVVWALGQFEAPEGLPVIEDMVRQTNDIGLLCIAIEALGRIGAQDSSPILMDTLYRVDKQVRCPEQVYRDFAQDEVLLSAGTNLVERLLYEIGRIGDPRSKPAMEKLQQDMTFPKTVRRLAGEIGHRLKGR